MTDTDKLAAELWTGLLGVTPGFGGDPTLPSKDFRLADFERAERFVRALASKEKADDRDLHRAIKAERDRLTSPTLWQTVRRWFGL